MEEPHFFQCIGVQLSKSSARLSDSHHHSCIARRRCTFHHFQLRSPHSGDGCIRWTEPHTICVSHSCSFDATAYLGGAKIPLICPRQLLASSLHARFPNFCCSARNS